LREKAASDAVNPMEIKMDLARRVITDFHSPDAARQAEEEFRHVFQQRQQPAEVETRSLSIDEVRAKSDGSMTGGECVIKLDRLLARVGLAASVGEAARKLREGAVSINGERCREPHYRLVASRGSELLVQVGRHHMKVVLQP
jgi:tyrosyl-tRNA synthetase